MPGFQELVVIAVVALLVFGPDRLPTLARQAGELVARFRAESQRSIAELQRMAEVRELKEELDGLRSELRGARDDVGRGLNGGSSRRGSVRARDAGGAVTTPFDPEAT